MITIQTISEGGRKVEATVETFLFKEGKPYGFRGTVTASGLAHDHDRAKFTTSGEHKLADCFAVEFDDEGEPTLYDDYDLGDVDLLIWN